MRYEVDRSRRQEDAEARGPEGGGDSIGRQLFLRRSALAAAGLAAFPFALHGCAGGSGAARAGAAEGECSPASGAS